MTPEQQLKIDKLLVKYQLLELDKDEVTGLYRDKTLYKYFLGVTKDLLESDQGFFMINQPAREFISEYINERRFNPENRDLINEENSLIRDINDIDNMKNKKDFIINYVKNDLDKRFGVNPVYTEIDKAYGPEGLIISSEIVKEFQTYDYIYYLLSELQDFSKVISNGSGTHFISSVNYLTGYIPEIFTEQVKEKSIEILDKIEERDLKKYVKRAKKNLIRL